MESIEQFYHNKHDLMTNKIVVVQQCAILFFKSQIPSGHKQRNRIVVGYLCISDQTFFHRHRNLNPNLAFQSDHNHFLKITGRKLKISATCTPDAAKNPLNYSLF